MANALSNIGKGVGNVLQEAGQALYRGFPETTIQRQLGEEKIKESKAQQGYLKSRSQYYTKAGEEGGRASVDRLLTIVRLAGDRMTPETLDTILTFALKEDPKLSSLFEQIHGKGIISSKNISISDVEDFRRFRNSIPEMDGSILPENQELYDNVSSAYNDMLNNLTKIYGPKKETKIEVPKTKSQEPVTFDWRTGGQISGPKALDEIESFGPQEKPSFEIPPLQGEEPITFDWQTGQQLTGKPFSFEKPKISIKKPDTPKSGDPAEIEAYKQLINIWGDLDRTIAEKILALRAAGVSYDKILTADELQPYLRK